MNRRAARIAIVLTLVPLSVSPTPADPDAVPPFTVHEWGTFTSIAGEDGMAVEWRPLAGPDDLPCFVDRLRFSVKGLIPGTVRMETPVLYFYAARDLTVSVTVRFRQGVVTEWFPNAAVTPSGVPSNSLRDPAFENSITWDDVRVVPASAPEFPKDDGASHYYAARDTDASPLESGGEKEKFLFYRGVGAFDPPLTAVVDPEGKIVVSDSRGEPVGDVMLFENRGGAIAYDFRHAGDSRMTFDPLGVPLTTSPSARFGVDGSIPPLVELERLLMAHGLYPKEAAAMIETWRDSWFEEGTRLFYVASRATVDAILPLEVTPAPTELERVFVGRIELVTPATESGVRAAIARRDVTALRKYSRFVNAIASRILDRSTPAEQARAQAFLQWTHAPWMPPASCE
jgi:hypothetical protein